jgi:hypothetical protein
MKNNKICEAAEIEFAMKLILNSRLVFSIVALVVGLTVAACSGQPAAPVVATLVPTVTPAPQGTLADVTITLERTACYGTCPVYKLTITGNGTVVYEGRDFVEVKGEQTSSISPAQVQDLVAAFEQADFLTLTDYMEQKVTDLPYAITSITIGGQTKTVNHYYGDDSAPQELIDLESKIDEIVNSKQWTGT